MAHGDPAPIPQGCAPKRRVTRRIAVARDRVTCPLDPRSHRVNKHRQPSSGAVASHSTSRRTLTQNSLRTDRAISRPARAAWSSPPRTRGAPDAGLVASRPRFRCEGGGRTLLLGWKPRIEPVDEDVRVNERGHARTAPCASSHGSAPSQSVKPSGERPAAWWRDQNESAAPAAADSRRLAHADRSE